MSLTGLDEQATPAPTAEGTGFAVRPPSAKPQPQDVACAIRQIDAAPPLSVDPPETAAAAPGGLSDPFGDRGVREPVVVSVTTALGTLEDEWRHFQETADCTPFQTYEWLSSWQRCVGNLLDVRPAVVTVRRMSGELLLILPLASERMGPFRCLAFLGRGLCDYNAPLVHPRFSTFVSDSGFGNLWDRALREIRNALGIRHDVIRLDRMPERVGGQHNPLMHLSTRHNPSSAYSTALGLNWETFYAERRSATTRQRERSKRKKLTQIGPVALITAERDETAGTLNHLFEQKRRSFERMGVANLFAQPGYKSFFADVAQSAPSLVHVSRLAVDECCAAANLGLVFRNCYFYVLTSYEDGPISRLGPGTVHLHELMKFAMVRGCTRFDFTIGDEAYKLDWADTKIDLFDHISGGGWLGRPAAAAIVAMQALKKIIKHSPQGLRLVNRLRAGLTGGGAKG